MDFRTDQFNALLLFTYNTQAEDYMLVSSVQNAPCIPVGANRQHDISMTASANHRWNWKPACFTSASPVTVS